MPLTKEKSNFDADLDFGKISEQEVVDMFESDGRIEVKTERDTWMRTGNIAFEIRYKGNPSGISTTKATWWIQALNYNNQNIMMLTFKISLLRVILKRMVKEKIAEIKKGGDDNNSTIILTPIYKLMREYLNYDEIYRNN
tara:strand:- start:10 stop:429 length:420 start_codon:yes stop_codon:yes gene_type:complete